VKKWRPTPLLIQPETRQALLYGKKAAPVASVMGGGAATARIEKTKKLYGK
jgi:hypothetical protein